MVKSGTQSLNLIRWIIKLERPTIMPDVHLRRTCNSSPDKPNLEWSHAWKHNATHVWAWPSAIKRIRYPLPIQSNENLIIQNRTWHNAGTLHRTCHRGVSSQDGKRERLSIVEMIVGSLASGTLEVLSATLDGALLCAYQFSSDCIGCPQPSESSSPSVKCFRGTYVSLAGWSSIKSSTAS